MFGENKAFLISFLSHLRNFAPNALRIPEAAQHLDIPHASRVVGDGYREEDRILEP